MQASKNDTIQIALIGAGGMGQGDARYSDEPSRREDSSRRPISTMAGSTRIKEVYGSGRLHHARLSRSAGAS